MPSGSPGDGADMGEHQADGMQPRSPPGDGWAAGSDWQGSLVGREGTTEGLMESLYTQGLGGYAEVKCSWQFMGCKSLTAWDRTKIK